MRYHAYGVLLGSCIVAFLSLSGYGRVIVDRATTLDSFSISLAQVPKCMGKTDVAACARPFVASMLMERGGTEVMQSLASLLTPLQCHYVGHIVGQQLYTQYEDAEAALATCDRSCDSACVHGVIGQAFAVALGHPDADDPNFDLEHLSPDDIREVGKKLCTTVGTCHGVGHTLFQAYKQLEPSFEMCRQIAGASIPTCFNGATMEYADILSSRNMRAVPDVRYPDPATLSSLCAYSASDEARACFRYFPRMVEETLKKQSILRPEAQKRTEEICASYRNVDHRMSCFAGIGSNRAYAVLTDTSAAVRGCEGFPTEFDQKACILGTVTIATEDRELQLVPYCAAQTSDSLRSFCYQGFFFLLYRARVKFDASLLCGKDELCSEAAEKYRLDAWENLKASFSE